MLSGRLLRIGPNPIDDQDQVRLARHPPLPLSRSLDTSRAPAPTMR